MSSVGALGPTLQAPPPLDYLFAGSASLAEQLDKPVIAVLRDGRNVVGTLISYDHFGSLILRDALERHVAGGKVCDLPMGGIYLIRGENLALLGELDPVMAAANQQLEPADLTEVLRLEKLEEERAKTLRRASAKRSWEMGE